MAFSLDGGQTSVDLSGVGAGDVVVYSDTELISGNDVSLSKSFTFPHDMEVTGIRLEFDASATVATRTIRYQFRHGDNDAYMIEDLDTTIVANETITYELNANDMDQDGTKGTSPTFPTHAYFRRIPRVRAGKGQIFAVSVTNADADADTGDSIVVHIRGVALGWSGRPQAR